MRINYSDTSSPLGNIRLAAKLNGLMGCYFHGQKYFPNCSDWQHSPENPLLNQVSKNLRGYFADGIMQLDFELDMQGTDFQKQVWRALLNIPLGEVITYSDLAVSVGRPQSVRAAAAAVGRNPLSIIVPCHRVIGKNNQLTGYAGGLKRKQKLLELEKQSH